jgi:peptidoglycan/LPS O-acetylase OafA/YrhL
MVETMITNNCKIIDSRLSELDWLRVILILAVFLHHVCMPFNGDGWHIMNNESSKILDDIMVYFEQFRLPILFFISGIGSVILLSKITVKKFVLGKFLRLFIPLLAGSLLVIPPQTYIENIVDLQSYWQEYPQLALNFDTNHLWFIEYLLVFFLFAIPLNKFFSSSLGIAVVNSVQKLSKYKIGLYLLVILLIVIKVCFSLMFSSDDNKIENLSSSSFYLFFFIAGMVFIHSKGIWQAVCEQRFYNLMLFFFSTILFYSYYYSPDLSEYLSLDIRWSIWWIVCCLVAWSALLTLLGYAQFYLTKTPKWLRLSNELIYPFYIFHQTVIVVIGYYVITWQVPILLKIISLFVLSFSITSVICWFVIKPSNTLRFLFGLKPLNKLESVAYQAS